MFCVWPEHRGDARRCRIIGNQLCPKCEKPFLAGEPIHATRSSNGSNDRPTSVTILAWLAFFGVFRSVVRVAAGSLSKANDAAAGAPIVADAIFEGIVSLALGLGLLNGYDWARRLYLWGFPLLIALSLALGEASAQWV